MGSGSLSKCAHHIGRARWRASPFPRETAGMQRPRETARTARTAVRRRRRLRWACASAARTSARERRPLSAPSLGLEQRRDAVGRVRVEVDARSKRRIINHLTQLDLELIGTLTKPCNIELMPARAAPPFPQPPLRTPSPPHWLIRCSTTTSKTRSPQSASGQCFGPQYNQPGS